jgi:scyllo-inosamine 4-kinase
LFNDSTLKLEAQHLLRHHGLHDKPITAASGFVNNVWMTPEVVIRLNNGRFRNTFHHEADVLQHLKGSIPVPEVLDVGHRHTNGEYIILRRLPGNDLEQAWPTMPVNERISVLHELGNILRNLHTIHPQDWMMNPWVQDARATGTFANGYHTPPHMYCDLIASAAMQRPEIMTTLEAAETFIAGRMAAFDGDTDVMVHGDMHFRNVMVHAGHVVGIIDFEGSLPAPADVELDMLLRELAPPSVTEGANHHAGVIGTLREGYPELFTHSALEQRIEVYEVIWQLVQLHHWQPGATWMDDPVHTIRQVLSGAFIEQKTIMLNESPISSS